MKMSFDLQVDALYIRFVDDLAEVTTPRLSKDVAINYASDGRSISIKIPE